MCILSIETCDVPSGGMSFPYRGCISEGTHLQKAVYHQDRQIAGTAGIVPEPNSTLVTYSIPLQF